MKILNAKPIEERKVEWITKKFLETGLFSKCKAKCDEKLIELEKKLTKLEIYKKEGWAKAEEVGLVVAEEVGCAKAEEVDWAKAEAVQEYLDYERKIYTKCFECLDKQWELRNTRNKKIVPKPEIKTINDSVKDIEIIYIKGKGCKYSIVERESRRLVKTGFVSINPAYELYYIAVEDNCEQARVLNTNKSCLVSNEEAIIDIIEEVA